MLWFMTLMFMVKECLSLLGFHYFACWALDTVGVLYVHSLAEVVGGSGQAMGVLLLRTYTHF